MKLIGWKNFYLNVARKIKIVYAIKLNAPRSQQLRYVESYYKPSYQFAAPYKIEVMLLIAYYYIVARHFLPPYAFGYNVAGTRVL
jgi:hypothetical protein